MSSLSVADTSDLMAAAMARLLRNGETVFHGVASPLPMVSILLAKRFHAPDLIYLNIPGGVDACPQKLPRSTVDPALLNGARAEFALSDIFDLSARGGLDVAFLSGVQIDLRGHINLSAIGEVSRPRVKLPGGAGSALLLPTARRTILWRTKHDTRVFVKRCDTITAAGLVDRVVTPLCIFWRKGQRLQLESLHPEVSLEEVQERTGFKVKIASPVPITPPLTSEEKRHLEAVDPGRVRDLEFR